LGIKIVNKNCRFDIENIPRTQRASLSLPQTYIFIFSRGQFSQQQKNPNKINRNNRNASNMPRGATILQTIRREAKQITAQES